MTALGKTIATILGKMFGVNKSKRDFKPLIGVKNASISVSI